MMTRRCLRCWAGTGDRRQESGSLSGPCAARTPAPTGRKDPGRRRGPGRGQEGSCARVGVRSRSAASSGRGRGRRRGRSPTCTRSGARPRGRGRGRRPPTARHSGPDGRGSRARPGGSRLVLVTPRPRTNVPERPLTALNVTPSVIVALRSVVTSWAKPRAWVPRSAGAKERRDDEPRPAGTLGHEAALGSLPAKLLDADTRSGEGGSDRVLHLGIIGGLDDHRRSMERTRRLCHGRHRTQGPVTARVNRRGRTVGRGLPGHLRRLLAGTDTAEVLSHRGWRPAISLETLAPRERPSVGRAGAGEASRDQPAGEHRRAGPQQQRRQQQIEGEGESLAFDGRVVEPAGFSPPGGPVAMPNDGMSRACTQTACVRAGAGAPSPTSSTATASGLGAVPR